MFVLNIYIPRTAVAAFVNSRATPVHTEIIAKGVASVMHIIYDYFMYYFI